MTDIEKQYLKLVALYKTDKDSAINRMIDIFQEVSESYEHEIYHSIMEWSFSNALHPLNLTSSAM